MSGKKVLLLTATIVIGSLITGTAGLESISPGHRPWAVVSAIGAAIVFGALVTLFRKQVHDSAVLGARRKYLVAVGAVAGVILAMSIPEGIVATALLGGGTGAMFMAIYSNPAL